MISFKGISECCVVKGLSEKKKNKTTYTQSAVIDRKIVQSNKDNLT